MGFNASALLAYGYDLGDSLNLDDEDRPRPAWAISDGDITGDARRALFNAAGGNVGPSDYLDDEHLVELCGITFAFYGSSANDGTPLLILAATRFDATMDSLSPVDFTLPDDADRRLDWALSVLGIEPPAARPQWLLAASFG